jgi:uncharacterized protein YndB with AHSA1/START domain
MPSFELFARSPAPVEAVWRRLADGRTWSEWNAFGTSELEREGTPEPDGVGAIRRLGQGPIVSREQILEFDPPRHLAYTILSGVPVRDYRADVELSADGSGTLISWRARFEPAIPGTGRVMRAFLRTALRSTSVRLARVAATDTS